NFRPYRMCSRAAGQAPRSCPLATRDGKYVRAMDKDASAAVRPAPAFNRHPAGALQTQAIVQARLGSTRLPYKVTRQVGKQPLLMHVIERLRACRTVQRIVVATGSRQENDLLEEMLPA